jgi:predicted transcriptional regulator YheO
MRLVKLLNQVDKLLEWIKICTMENTEIQSKKKIQRCAESQAAALPLLKTIAHSIVQTFGAEVCEVVIHNLSDLEHSIVYIEGDVTHRKIGDSITDLGLAKVSRGEFADLFNYRTVLDDGATLKSSSTFLHNETGEVWGAFCINFNISPWLQLQRSISLFTNPEDQNKVSETFNRSIEETIRGMLADCANQIGKSVPKMNHEERIELVRMLEQKGAFRVRRAVPIVAQSLKVSRYTVYNYLANKDGQSSTRQHPEPAKRTPRVKSRRK